jgi:hypothetical protein
MLRVRHKLVPLLLAVLGGANLLSLDLGHNHRPHSVAGRDANSSPCLHGCQHAHPQPAQQQQGTPLPDFPCQDDDCVACRYLAQLQVVQITLTSDFEAEHVEPTVAVAPVLTPCPLVLCHHSRAPPCRIA